MSPDDLEAHRQAIHQTHRNGDGGITGQVGGDGQRPVVGEGRLEAMFGDEVDVAYLGGHRAFGGEGYVGVGSGEYEVDLVEDGCHRLVDCDSEHLRRSGRFDVEVMTGEVHAELDLRSEVVVPIGSRPGRRWMPSSR